MDSSTAGNVEINDHNILLEQHSSHQEIKNFIKIEDIKVEPFCPELSCSPLEPVVKDEAEVPKQSIKPMILLSTSGEQGTAMKLEMKIEPDDLENWKDKLMDFDGKETGSAVPEESTDQQETQNGMENMYETQADLPDHSMLHTNAKLHRLHKCDVCGKTFRRKSHMNLHILTHTGEKPYECDVCGKAFAQKSTTSYHMMIHTGERPHKCDVCGKAFIRKCDLNRHMLTHSGKKPPECHICGVVFRHKSRINLHMMIHTEQKPHEFDAGGKGLCVNAI